MPPSAPQRQYFLGIEGEQLGPFSKQGVIDKIQAGEVPEDAMVWWEGLADWRQLSDLTEFKASANPAVDIPEKSPLIPSSRPPTLREALKEPPREFAPPTFSPSPVEMRPVFSQKHFQPSDAQIALSRTWALGAGACFMFGLAAVLHFRLTTVKPNITPKRTIARAQKEKEERQRRVTTATSQLFLNPNESIARLNEIISKNANDDAGREAVEALLDYYRQANRTIDAAHLLTRLNRHAEAAPLYAANPNGAALAEEAYFKAFSNKSDPKRADYLKQNIQLLLTPLNNRAVALERIKLFEKTFPGTAHPFGYYLLSTDKKIENLFQRISFSFVQSLVNYLQTEFPQVHLAMRPLVEVKKSVNGDYRIQGSYRGDIVLNQDKLQDVFFTFWLVKDQWVLADTNLTQERQRQTASVRKKITKLGTSGAEFLTTLENRFRAEFPGTAPHESLH